MKTVLIVSLIMNLLALVLFQNEGVYNSIKATVKNSISPKQIQMDDLKAISIFDDYVSINGLPFSAQTGDLYRLPKSVQNTIRPELWRLGNQPSGGRIRFKTDSDSVMIVAQSSSTVAHHMTSIMKNGMDLYVDNVYSGSAWPDANGNIKKRFQIRGDGSKNITIYLPLYSSVTIEKLYVEKNAAIYKADDLSGTSPIVYYGSSITQGACASNPGMSYEAIISRRTGIDFINFGFSNNGVGDIEIAELISELDSSVIVLDYWANPTPMQYQESLPDFVDTIRKVRSETPILLISPFYTVGAHEEQRKKREIAFNFVTQRQELGDKHIYFMDGKKMLSKENASGLVDGVHLNSLGFWFSANALEPELLKLIDKH